MRATLAITGAELRRFLRDRSNIFFAFIFPLLLVLVIGAQFGGEGPTQRVAMAGESGTLTQAITTRLAADGVEVTTGERDDVLEQVSRGRAAVALIVPAGTNAAHAAGTPVTIEMVTGSSTSSLGVQQKVRTAVDALQLGAAQGRALVDRGLEPAAAASALAAARGTVAEPSLRIEDVNRLSQEFAGLGKFDLGAASQMLLFVFLISLAGTNTLIQARRHGIIARTLAAPVSTRQVLLGQAGGRFTIAVLQGLYIIVMTALLFDVNWGNLALTGLVLVLFAAVSAGAAMVLGAVTDNENVAAGLGVGLGLVLAGLGGAMAPLEIFSEPLRLVAHVTPHAWAYEAFAEIQRHGAGLVDILPQLAVLAAMAVVALAVGTWALRRSVARAM